MKSQDHSREGVRILVVDDLTSMRKMVRKLLLSLGYTNVREARDAGEAIGILRYGDFDLIISDWNMPTMTGCQLLEFVRGHSRLQKVPFMMLTMQTDSESVLAAKERGVSHYLAKPFTAADLEQKLRDMIGPNRNVPG